MYCTVLYCTVLYCTVLYCTDDDDDDDDYCTVLMMMMMIMMMFSRCQLDTMIFVKLCSIYDDVQQVPTAHNDLC